ncbi:MAG: hypothetical protein H6873_04245 [Hyphomicrobiaceae bacterium]|nr:hypothetical protein [Hyphomicrobiaceae bacterium]
MNEDLLARLRAVDVAARVGELEKPSDHAVFGEFLQSGIRFVASSDQMEQRYYQAVRELIACIKPTFDAQPILNEGGIYYGCWLESTGTINGELLSRFIPSVAQTTYAAFARFQRADGCIPYKLTTDGAVFSQIQMVTPLARCVWNHYQLNGRDREFLEAMYGAMNRNDNWLAANRDTRGTGGVEAFCTYDTGHDLSSRFWHVPDSPKDNDPGRYNTDNPILPFVAPDLTANVACQRSYLALIAEELGLDGSEWRRKAERSVQALYENCYVAEDGYFYDLDRNMKHVRVQSDVLSRVLACEIGDDDFFAASLDRYLLNTSKFFAKYPFTSVALDDPRYDPAFDYNSWCGPTNFLTLIRAPHAFEHHHRHVELTWMIHPILNAMFQWDRFPQTLNPFTGAAGFTEVYSPAILALLDFIERLCGILPRPDGQLWFTGLVPQQIDHRDARHRTAYARQVDGTQFELVNSEEGCEIYRNGESWLRFPKGVRVVTDRSGMVRSLIGMNVAPVRGELVGQGRRLAFDVAANQQLDLSGDEFHPARAPGLVTPSY